MSALAALLLRLFPAAFRNHFGAEIVQQAQEDYRRARSRGRLWACLDALLSTLDLMRAAAAERWNPPLPARRVSHGGSAHGRFPPRAAHAAALARLRGRHGRHARPRHRRQRRDLQRGRRGAARSAAVPEPDRLVYIAATAPGSDLPGEFELGRRVLPAVPGAVASCSRTSRIYGDFTSTLRTGDRVERIRMSWSTNSLFTTLGVPPDPRPAAGAARTRTGSRDQPRAVATWFGADPAVIGRTYDVAGAAAHGDRRDGPRVPVSRPTARCSGFPAVSGRRTS